MLNLQLPFKASASPRFLFIGAHCDDIEIGCGGTVLTLLRRFPRCEIHWFILSSDPTRAAEAKRSAGMFLRGAQRPRLTIRSHRNSFFPAEFTAIKTDFEELKGAVTPDVVFTHYRADLHQDHRIASELTWNTFRSHMILEYEIPKYDGDLGSPSLFVPLDPASVRRKVSILMKAFGTQRSKQWFTPATFEGLLRLRGIECNAPGGYAEAFHCRKLVI